MGRDLPPAIPGEECYRSMWFAYDCYFDEWELPPDICDNPGDWWGYWLWRCPGWLFWGQDPNCYDFWIVNKLVEIYGCVHYDGHVKLQGSFKHTHYSPDGIEPYLSYGEAYDLAVEYGFSPLPSGKFEPDKEWWKDERVMLLANWRDKTNILIKYDRTQLPHYDDQ